MGTERERGSSFWRMSPPRRQCAPQILPSARPWTRTRRPWAPGGEAAGTTACAHPAKTRRGETLPTRPPRSWRASPGKAPRQRALRPSRCNPTRSQSHLHKLVCPRQGQIRLAARARVLAGRPRRQDSPRDHSRLGHQPSGAPSPQPRSAPKLSRPHDPGVLGKRTRAPRTASRSSPRLRTSALSSGGADGRRAESRARSTASGGRGAGERAPGLHMLTRAARGQRPASAGS